MYLWSYMIDWWIFKSLYFIISVEYINFRLFQMEGFYNLVIHTYILLMLPLAFYLKDKFNKNNFYDLF